MATIAARSALRSATTSARGATARLSAGVKPRAASSPLRVTPQKPLSARIFRSPVEMSSVSMVSMLPPVPHCNCLCIAYFDALCYASLPRVDS